MSKIAAVATQAFTRNGESFAKGEKLSLTAGELHELEHIGFAERAPDKTKASPKPAAKPPIESKAGDTPA